MSEAPNTSNRIQILHEFELFFRIIKAHNVNNFVHLNWRTKRPRVFDVFWAILTHFASIFVIVLLIWDFVENNSEENKFVVSFPILIGLLMEESAIVDVM